MSKVYFDLESDKIIKKSLIDNEIIISKRIIYCGKWFNKISNNSNISTPIIFYCKKWECRICRNKLINEISKKHSKINSKFLNRGGNLIMISFFSFTRKTEIAEDMFSKFKHCLRLLKESRCWLKLKKILDCKYHYENTGVLYKDNEYKFHNNIIYGSSVNKIDINLIEELIITYWSKILKKCDLNTNHFQNIQITNYWDIVSNKKDTITNSSNFNSINIYENTKVNGTLENLESQFCKLANTPPTNLKSIQYLSRMELKELGSVIQKMYLINSKFRRGRIWYPSN